jgi:hypothetical protein
VSLHDGTRVYGAAWRIEESNGCHSDTHVSLSWLPMVEYLDFDVLVLRSSLTSAAAGGQPDFTTDGRLNITVTRPVLACVWAPMPPPVAQGRVSKGKNQ